MGKVIGLCKKWYKQGYERGYEQAKKDDELIFAFQEGVIQELTRQLDKFKEEHNNEN